MNIVDRLRAFLGAKQPEPEHTELIYIYLPEPLDPIEREDRYGDPIDAELQLRGLGYVSGGGSLMSEEDADGERTIKFCGIDVDATDVPAARELVRQQLPTLGCQTGTKLYYQKDGAPLQDEFDGAGWVNGQPRDELHPGLGV